MLLWSIIVFVVMLMIFLQDVGATMAASEDPAMVEWSHATNSKKALLEALSSGNPNGVLPHWILFSASLISR